MSKRATFPIATSALVLLTLSSTPAEAHDEIRVSEPILIEDPQNRDARASDINNRGVVVGSVETLGTNVPFSWSLRTGFIELPLPIENGAGQANAINDCGEIVGETGFSPQPHFFRHAARWTRSGEVEDLGAFPIEEPDDKPRVSAATDINELGVVVGWSTLGVHADDNHAFIWTEADGMRDLGSLGPFDSTVPFAINNRNEVVGVNVSPSGRQRAFYWSERTGMIDLGLEADRESFALGINDRGVVVGNSASAGFTWTRQRGLRRLADPDESDFAFPFPRDISRGGLIVGNIGQSAALWVRPNKVVTLSANPGVDAFATAINDKGKIVGWITLDPHTGTERAALWRIGRGFVNPPDPKEIDQLCKRPRN